MLASSRITKRYTWRRIPGIAPDEAGLRFGFTLIEVLVVVAIIALLVAILVPSLARARASARRAVCLSNLKGLETAHWIYMTSNRGYLIRAGLMHNTAEDKDVAWIDTLRDIYKDRLSHRCVADDSPHWPADEGGDGVPVDNPGVIVVDETGSETVVPRYRRTSYGINNFLDVELGPSMLTGREVTWAKIEKIPTPSRIVHFLEMVRACDPDNPEYEPNNCFAGSDHPHVESWADLSHPAIKAATQLEIGAHGGPKWAPECRANYGFLDGHAETVQFQKVYAGLDKNKFDPGLLINYHRVD